MFLKIVLQIKSLQNEELKNIIVTHKDLYGDFLTLHYTLCQNIDHFLYSPKENGHLYVLYKTISDKFDQFEYGADACGFKSCEKRKKQRCQITRKSYNYKTIAKTTDKMKDRIEKFEATNSFYNTAAINKYIPGLKRFDISRAIQRRDEKHLLCEEFFKQICEEYPDYIVELCENKEWDAQHKIKALNEFLDLKNNIIISTALETIEYAIELERYIDKFGKAFALKTRRKDLPLEIILENHK